MVVKKAWPWLTEFCPVRRTLFYVWSSDGRSWFGPESHPDLLSLQSLAILGGVCPVDLGWKPGDLGLILIQQRKWVAGLSLFPETDQGCAVCLGAG